MLLVKCFCAHGFVKIIGLSHCRLADFCRPRMNSSELTMFTTRCQCYSKSRQDNSPIPSNLKRESFTRFTKIFDFFFLYSFNSQINQKLVKQLHKFPNIKRTLSHTFSDVRRKLDINMGCLFLTSLSLTDKIISTLNPFTLCFLTFSKRIQKA